MYISCVKYTVEDWSIILQGSAGSVIDKQSLRMQHRPPTQRPTPLPMSVPAQAAQRQLGAHSAAHMQPEAHSAAQRQPEAHPAAQRQPEAHPATSNHLQSSCISRFVTFIRPGDNKTDQRKLTRGCGKPLPKEGLVVPAPYSVKSACRLSGTSLCDMTGCCLPDY